MDKNILVLAYLGDSVFEIMIRKYLIEQGINKVNTLQKEAIKYVSAKGQCSFVTKLIEENKLSSEELEIFYRGRNHKSNSFKEARCCMDWNRNERNKCNCESRESRCKTRYYR